MNDAPQKDPQKLFVGNVPWSMTEEDLVEIFAQYGELDENEGVHLATDRHSGRSKGIAFVKYQNKEAADAAVKGENGKEYDGRPLRVDVAQPRKPRENRGGYNSRGGNRGSYGNRRQY